MKLKQVSFLENTDYAFLIAKIVIVIQTLFTCSISIVLLRSMYKDTFGVQLLMCILLLNILFIGMHLAYRVLYRGQQVLLTHLEKKILFVHVLTSLLALIGALYIATSNDTVIHLVYILDLLMWFASLSSGVVFFYVKYKKSLTS